jgi:hypothetical protein
MRMLPSHGVVYIRHSGEWKCESRGWSVRSDGTTGYDRATVCGMQPRVLFWAAAAERRGGRLFFKTRWLLVYSNIRPARSQHTHAPRLTSRWARPSPRCCCCPVVPASQHWSAVCSCRHKLDSVDGSFHHWFLVTQCRTTPSSRLLARSMQTQKSVIATRPPAVRSAGPASNAGC